MKSLEELKELREQVQKDMKTRSEKKMPEIIIGMGTCGISAGAREIMKTVIEETEKRSLDVKISQTGCIGMCEKEPLMDVKLPGKERVTYGELKANDVKKIIAKHVINGTVVDELAIARLEE